MITVRFFARYREQLNCEQLQLETGDYPKTVSLLRQQLAEKGSNWQEVLMSNHTLIAINQAMIRADHELCEGDEVAFFPPVTGG